MDDRCGADPCLREPHALGAWALLAGLDIERHLLAAAKPVEADGRLQAIAVEEVLFPVVGSDESEPAVGHNLLDDASCHGKLPTSRNSAERADNVREAGSLTATAAPCSTQRGEHTTCATSTALA